MSLVCCDLAYNIGVRLSTVLSRASTPHSAVLLAMVMTRIRTPRARRNLRTDRRARTRVIDKLSTGRVIGTASLSPFGNLELR